MSEKCLDNERVAVWEFCETCFLNSWFVIEPIDWVEIMTNYRCFSLIISIYDNATKKSQEKVSISDCFTFVCVLLGPVNNGRWCCELRAGGRWKFGCLTVWRCGSRWVVSAPPCLLLWTHTVVTHPAANLARPATHQKTGIAGEKCGRKYLKMELWIGWKGARMSQN